MDLYTLLKMIKCLCSFIPSLESHMFCRLPFFSPSLPLKYLLQENVAVQEQAGNRVQASFSFFFLLPFLSKYILSARLFYWCVYCLLWTYIICYDIFAFLQMPKILNMRWVLHILIHNELKLVLKSCHRLLNYQS